MSFFYSQLFVRPPLPNIKFTNKTVLVTGANVGIGLEAARHYVNLDAARVIITSRDASAGQRAIESIEQSTKRIGVVECWSLDLSNYSSIIDFAQRIDNTLDRLDIVAANAGTATAVYELKESLQSTLTVNVVGTLLLGILLLPKMKHTFHEFSTDQTQKPSMTFVVSEIHPLAPVWQLDEASTQNINVFDHLSTEANQKFSIMAARYAVSKLLEVAAVRSLADFTISKSFPAGDYPVIINMTTPGLCKTQLDREALGVTGVVLATIKFFIARTAAIGARTLISGAALGQESHGKYIYDGYIRENGIATYLVGPGGAAKQEKIWNDLKAKMEGARKGVMELI